MKAVPPRSMTRHVALTAVSHFVVPATALLAMPILARGLGVEGRGELAAAIAPLQLAVAIFAFGLPQVMVHHVASQPASLGRLLRPVLSCQLVASVAGVIVVFVAAPALGGEDAHLVDMIRLAALTLPGSLLVGVVSGIASGLHQWPLVTAQRVASEVLKLLAIVILAAAGELTVFAAVLITACSPVVSGLLYVPLVFRAPRRGSAPSNEPPMTSRALAYGARVWIGALSGILLTRVAQVLIAPLVGVAALGLYVVAVNVADAALLANNAVRDVTLASDSAERRSARATYSARVSFAVSVALGVAIALSMPFWFESVFGHEFGDAVAIAIALVFANVLGVPGSVAGAVLSARGMPGKRSVSLVVASAVNLVLLVGLLPIVGLWGAVVAALVGNLIASNMNIYFVKRYFEIPMRDFYAIGTGDIRMAAAQARGLLRR